MAVSPCSRYIASGSSEGGIYLWDTEGSGNDGVRLLGHELETSGLDWGKDRVSRCVAIRFRKLIVLADVDCELLGRSFAARLESERGGCEEGEGGQGAAMEVEWGGGGVAGSLSAILCTALHDSNPFGGAHWPGEEGYQAERASTVRII